MVATIVLARHRGQRCGHSGPGLQNADAVIDFYHIARHGLHDHSVDMCDLVVAGVDRVHRADAGRYMPVNMKAELVRFLDAGLEPLEIEGAIEFYAGEAFLLRLLDQRDGFGLARGNVGDLSGVGTFAVGGAVQMSTIARNVVRDRCRVQGACLHAAREITENV